MMTARNSIPTSTPTKPARTTSETEVSSGVSGGVSEIDGGRSCAWLLPASATATAVGVGVGVETTSLDDAGGGGSVSVSTDAWSDAGAPSDDGRAGELVGAGVNVDVLPGAGAVDVPVGRLGVDVAVLPEAGRAGFSVGVAVDLGVDVAIGLGVGVAVVVAATVVVGSGVVGVGVTIVGCGCGGASVGVGGASSVPTTRITPSSVETGIPSPVRLTISAWVMESGVLEPAFFPVKVTMKATPLPLTSGLGFTCARANQTLPAVLSAVLRRTKSRLSRSPGRTWRPPAFGSASTTCTTAGSKLRRMSSPYKSRTFSTRTSTAAVCPSPTSVSVGLK